ncbi:MAG TPA: ATP-binding cassette domain-containing protein [Smithellaceae bacterium]|nr:ATP-binding cassette domain-containing protein [Smithellaceae bacterium]
MNKPLMNIRSLRKVFKLSSGFIRAQERNLVAVNNINLDIDEGETLGLVGESGCGKSTLAKIILRLEKPSAGNILFKGKDIISFDRVQLKAYRRNVQLIFQDPYSSLNPRKTAAGIIREPLTIHNVADNKKRDSLVEEMMLKVGLSAQHAKRYPHEFSGGQRQRLGIARALILQPQLIIADEPVSALDVSIQAQILNLLKDLKKDFGLTYLFISHDLNVIRHMSDRIAIMYLGEIVELSSNHDIYENPLHPYTRMLLAAAPVCNPRIKKNVIAVRGEAVAENNRGCAFQNRCAYRTGICSEQEPPLADRGNNRYCACHRAGEI